MGEPVTAAKATVTGTVQGVGFRPFVHRIASEHNLVGRVGNDASSVFIELGGTAEAMAAFLCSLERDAPPLARIDAVHVDALPIEQIRGCEGFEIVASRSSDGARTSIPPDTAVCRDCVAELFDSKDRRFGHPFITCTNCGPRLSIIEGLPYDRPSTTMRDFDLCAECAAEYHDPADRRHHAQPIGCHECGPTLQFGIDLYSPVEGSPIAAAAAAIADGAVVAVKGVGGYHLVCDATDADVVGALRRRKHRPDKPFAVMIADLAGADELVALSPAERSALASPAAPIVLARRRRSASLPELVAPGSPFLGVLLPYTPVHHLLQAELRRPLVVTSANPSGAPLAHTEARISELGTLYDAVLSHDRPICVPVDDSVVREVGGAIVPIRRARGYAPVPVSMPRAVRDALAVGGELKNTFCIASGGRAWVSPHLGDMENLETLESLEGMAAGFLRMYDVVPEVVAVDAHPGYLSSKWARRTVAEPVIEVQHHHAHVAAVMAEHGLDPDTAVLGFAFDGTGYGPDGTIWGGEVLEASATSCVRRGHLHPVELPGGDEAVRNPHRVALAHLHAAGVEWSADLAPCAQLSEGEWALLAQQLDRSIACVPTTSMGRLFDAVASLLDVRHRISYEAQAAIELEILAASATDAEADAVPLAFGTDALGGMDQRPLIRSIVAALRAAVPARAIARSFHIAVAEAVQQFAAHHGAPTVVLSGGVFQNALLVELCADRLAGQVDVRTHHAVPANDGGLSLGQAFVAAHTPSFT